MEEKNKIDCPLECGARIIYFTKHLKKCRNKNLLGTEFKICPYNDILFFTYQWLFILCTIITIISGTIYLWKNKSFLRDIK